MTRTEREDCTQRMEEGYNRQTPSTSTYRKYGQFKLSCLVHIACPFPMILYILYLLMVFGRVVKKRGKTHLLLFLGYSGAKLYNIH